MKTRILIGGLIFIGIALQTQSSNGDIKTKEVPLKSRDPLVVKPPVITNCSNIMEAILAYRTERLTQDAREMNDFSENVKVMQSWYSHYSSYEGGSYYIAPGTFDVIRSSAEIEYQNARDFNSTKTNLIVQLSDIIGILPNCLK